MEQSIGLRKDSCSRQFFYQIKKKKDYIICILLF